MLAPLLRFGHSIAVMAPSVESMQNRKLFFMKKLMIHFTDALTDFVVRGCNTVHRVTLGTRRDGGGGPGGCSRGEWNWYE